MGKFWALAVFIGTGAGTLGCSTKNDVHQPVAETKPVAGTGSYALNGRTVSATGYAVYNAARNSTGNDALTVVLTDTPAGFNEAAQLVFAKPAGSPDSSYGPYGPGLIHVASAANAGVGGYYKPNAVTLVRTASGGWSGTFTGTLVDATGTPVSELTAGVFTDVPLK